MCLLPRVILTNSWKYEKLGFFFFFGKDKVESNNDFILMWNSTLVFSDQRHKQTVPFHNWNGLEEH